MLNDKKEEVPANILDKVTYSLHPTFAQPIRRTYFPPLSCCLFSEDPV